MHHRRNWRSGICVQPVSFCPKQDPMIWLPRFETQLHDERWCRCGYDGDSFKLRAWTIYRPLQQGIEHRSGPAQDATVERKFLCLLGQSWHRVINLLTRSRRLFRQDSRGQIDKEWRRPALPHLYLNRTALIQLPPITLGHTSTIVCSLGANHIGLSRDQTSSFRC